MKKLFLIIAILLSLVSLSLAALPFTKDIIVTSPDGIWTDARAYTTLNLAIDACGTDVRTIVIPTAQAITTDTIPATITLRFERDGSIANSGQLTINTSQIEADSHQIFTGAGDIDFLAGTTVKSSWFADLDEALDVTSDDTVTILISAAETTDDDMAVGDDVTLRWESPFIITVDAGDTLSNVKNIEAGDYQILAGAGDVDFLDGTELRSAWFPLLRTATTWVEDEEVTISINEAIALDMDLTTAANESIEIKNGGSIDGAFTATLNGPFEGSPGCFGSSVTVAGLNKSDSLWFAKGDGATSDLSALKKWASSIRTNGTLVLSATTTYYEVEIGALTDAITVSASGANVQIDGTIKNITAPVAEASPAFILYITADDVDIFGNGILQGSGAFVQDGAISAVCPGLIRVTGDNCFIKDISMIDPPEIGIYGLGEDATHIKGLTIHNVRSVGGPTDADFNDANRQHYTFAGKYVDNVSVTECRILIDPVTGGFPIQSVQFSYGETFTIANCNFITHEGIYLIKVNKVLIDANNLTGQDLACIIVKQGSHVVVSDNIVDGSRGGISFTDQSGITVTGNYLYNMTGTMINIRTDILDASATRKGLDNIIIDGNYCEGSTTLGDEVLKGIRIKGYDAADADEFSGGENIIISKNTILNAGNSVQTGINGSSIYVKGGKNTGTTTLYPVKNLTITENIIIDSSGIGIDVERVERVIIAKNEIENVGVSDTNGKGIRATYFDTLSVEGNLVESSSDMTYGIIFEGDNSGASVINNKIIGATTAFMYPRNFTYTRRGNAVSDDRMNGLLVLNGVSTLITANKNITDDSIILIVPYNVYAATAEGSVKKLYQSALTAGTSFAVDTADGNAVPAQNHRYLYEIIQ